MYKNEIYIIKSTFVDDPVIVYSKHNTHISFTLLTQIYFGVFFFIKFHTINVIFHSKLIYEAVLMFFAITLVFQVSRFSTWRKMAQNQIENNIREQEINTFNFVTVVLCTNSWCGQKYVQSIQKKKTKKMVI